VPVGRETVRRWLHAAGLVWRRPRPVPGPKDPQRAAKLRALRALLHGLPEDETAVFMDEVEVQTNPKVGCTWMRRGQQATVPTPGTDERRVLAGSLHWRTGRAFLTEGLPDEGRSAALFCRHLDDLRRALRHYRVIHVVCDNARTHKPEGSRLVKAYLKEWGGRVVIHYLPAYAPECNPVERVWWRLPSVRACTSVQTACTITGPLERLSFHDNRHYFTVRILYGKPFVFGGRFNTTFRKVDSVLADAASVEENHIGVGRLAHRQVGDALRPVTCCDAERRRQAFPRRAWEREKPTRFTISR
jgi:transposase